jgi:hypothetical protein
MMERNALGMTTAVLLTGTVLAVGSAIAADVTAAVSPTPTRGPASGLGNKIWYLRSKHWCVIALVSPVKFPNRIGGDDEDTCR